jgi:hypothetical protein
MPGGLGSLPALNGPWPGSSTLQCSLPKAFIREVVQHLRSLGSQGILG